MKKTNSENATDDTRAELGFPYSLELVATIAAHFATAKAEVFALAAQHAIELIDAAAKTIKNKNTVLRSKQKQARTLAAIPSGLGFTEGVKSITGQRSEESATASFIGYLQLNVQLGQQDFPPEFEAKDIATLRPLSEAQQGKVKERLITYQRTGFRRDELVSIKNQYDRQATLMRSHKSAESGKKGGRPMGSKDTIKRQSKKTSQKP